MRIHCDRVAYICLRTTITCTVYLAAVPCFADLLLGTAFESGVRRIDETTGAELPGSIASGSAGLFLTSGVTVGPDGNIYVSSRGTGEVLFYDGDTGLPLPSPHAGGRAGLFATLAPNPDFQPPAPGPLRFGPDGNLYVSDFGGTQVRKFDGATGVEMSPAATAFVGPPAGLTFDASGNLYFGDFGSASVTKVVGGAPSQFIAPQAGGLVTPSSLLFLPNGNLLVVDLFGNKILGFDSTGQNVTMNMLVPPPIPDPLPPGVTVPSNNPSDIALDDEGNLYLAVLGLTNPPDNRGAVLRIDSQGLLHTVLEMQTPIGSIALIDPSSFLLGDYDRNGTVEAADYGKWKSDFGNSVALGDGADGNGNGIVDAADYVVWRNAFGGESLAAASSVPEPTSVVLTLFALALGLSRRASRMGSWF